MRQLVLVLAIAALVLPASALAKGGPSGASIDGPGGSGPTAFTGDALYVGTQLGDLTWYGGYFQAVRRQEPDPMLASRPKGDLGPKYTITYTVPGLNNESHRIRQDVYPYAKPSPVTYMEPGQKIPDGQTHGGWFRADPRFMRPLVAAGLPEQAPATSPGDSSFPIDLVAVLAAALLLATATAVLVRRRIRPAQAT
jgi:hypothetical protein